MDHFRKILKHYKLPTKTEPVDFFKANAVDLDNEFAGNRTLLQNAILSQDEDLFDTIMMIQKGAATKPPNVNTPDRTPNRWTALHYAVMNGLSEGKDIVEELLEAKADPNIRDASGKVPLQTAIEIGSLSLMESLIKHGANINAGGYLQIALISDRPEAYTYLLRQENIDIEMLDEEGNNALHSAAGLGYNNEAKEFLEKAQAKGLLKKLINAQNKNGNTVLHEAVLGRHKDIETLLKGFTELDTSIKNKRGQTAGQVKEAQMEEAKAKQTEEQMALMRKRRHLEAKQKERVVLNERAQKVKKEEEDEEVKPSFFSQAWVKCVMAFLVLMGAFYLFFYLYIENKKVILKHH